MSENQESAKTRPFSIRLTEAERAHLATRAGATPLPNYVRGLLVGSAADARRSRQMPLKDREPLARALAVLGKSQIGDSLSRLARLAETGSLYCDPKTLAGLQRACEDVRAMRTLLMEALGKDTAEKPSATFNEAAGRTYP